MSEASPFNRRRFLGLGAVTMLSIITQKGDASVWTQNRWYGLLTPGRELTTYFELAGRLDRQPSVAGYFVKLNSNFDATLLRKFGDRGITPFLTLEPRLWQMGQGDFNPDYSLASLNAGNHDAALLRIATSIGAYNKPVFLRLAHEMNGHWYPWAVGVNGNIAAQYLDFWKRVRDIFAIAPKIKWVWACAAIHALRTTAPIIDTLLPGDDLFDFAGTTGYAWDASAEKTYGPTFTRLTTLTDRDFIIPEMGAEPHANAVGVTGSDWVRSFGTYLRANQRIRGFVWFHISPALGATGDYRLQTPEVFAALNTTLAEIPVMSNTTLVDVDADLPVGIRDAVNPTDMTYVSNVIQGHTCSATGPTRGFDKYGNLYECWIHPQGWNRWRRLP